MSFGLKTSLANNAPQVGYYKFTANEPAQFQSADKFLASIGLVRIPSTRIRKPKPCRKK